MWAPRSCNTLTLFFSFFLMQFPVFSFTRKCHCHSDFSGCSSEVSLFGPYSWKIFCKAETLKLSLFHLNTVYLLIRRSVPSIRATEVGMDAPTNIRFYKTCLFFWLLRDACCRLNMYLGMDFILFNPPWDLGGFKNMRMGVFYQLWKILSRWLRCLNTEYLFVSLSVRLRHGVFSLCLPRLFHWLLSVLSLDFPVALCQLSSDLTSPFLTLSWALSKLLFIYWVLL